MELQPRTAVALGASILIPLMVSGAFAANLPRCHPAPKLLYASQPELPPRERMPYPVSLRLDVDVAPDGSVSNPVVVNTTRPNDLDYFGPPVLKAVLKWRYEQVKTACRREVAVNLTME